MTPEQKVALLKEAGVWDVIGFPGCIDKLIALVAAHERRKCEQEMGLMEEHCAELILIEREACAKVCDEYADKCVDAENWEAEDVSLHCAAAIRGRSHAGN